MRRVLAVVAAAAMVAGSLALRSRLDRSEKDRSRVLRLVCASELEEACQAVRRESGPRVELTVEAAGTTADRLARATEAVDVDGWLVTAPWPAIVDGARRARALPPLFAPAGAPLARSPLVLVMWKDRSAVLAPRCNGPVGWRCLGEAAGTAGGWAAIGGRPEWGPVKPGHADPTTDDAGLLVLGQATAAYFGRSDLSTTDLDDDGFQRWFAGLERAVPPSPGSPLNTMLTVGPAALDAVGTTEAEAVPVLRRSAGALQAKLAVLYPAPMATADLVLATVDAAPGASALRDVVSGDRGRRALAAGGWRVAGVTGPGPEGTPAGAVSLPPTSGLPSPGLLDALRARAHEVTGR